MAQDINLDGSEITILKALGMSGSEISGDELTKRIPNMNVYEIGDLIRGLIAVGYVESDRSSFYSEAELRAANFCVNSGYIKDLRDALDPRPEAPKSRRVRRE